MGCNYSRLRVPSKREKCPVEIETAAGKRQTGQTSGHVTLCVVRGKKNAVLNLSNVRKFSREKIITRGIFFSFQLRIILTTHDLNINLDNYEISFPSCVISSYCCN